MNITSSSLDRFAIYTALGIPEIWRYDGQMLTIYHLKAGEYRVNPCSLAFPMLPASDVAGFLKLRFPKQPSQTAVGENSIVKQFRQWLRSQL